MRQSERKPLVVMTPKSLLRLPEAASPLEAFTSGSFEEALDDPALPPPQATRRVVLTSGKFFYDLDAHRRQASVGEVAILRVEELYPFPAERIAALLERYERIEDVIWAQEEPRNMGAWNYLSEELRRVLAPGQSLRAVTRRESPSPATGSHRRHVAQQAALVAEALVGAPEGRAANPPRKVGAAG